VISLSLSQLVNFSVFISPPVLLTRGSKRAVGWQPAKLKFLGGDHLPAKSLLCALPWRHNTCKETKLKELATNNSNSEDFTLLAAVLQPPLNVPVLDSANIFLCILSLRCSYNTTFLWSTYVQLTAAHLPAVEFARVCGGATQSCPKNLNTVLNQKLKMIIYPALMPFMPWQR